MGRSKHSGGSWYEAITGYVARFGREEKKGSAHAAGKEIQRKKERTRKTIEEATGIKGKRY